MDPAGIPAFNTLVLLSSSVTMTWAHWGIKRGRRLWPIAGLGLTLCLGVLFLALQAHEYLHASRELNLKPSSGVYGSTFFLLTGFHGAHVTVGALMLAVMLARAVADHFSRGNYLAFEAAPWHWHFVDVVCLCLFTFVYWL
jgi:cytochrome c oxidase subunit 3